MADEVFPDFGIYNDDVDSKEVLSIAGKEEIKQGKATIRTVLEDSNVKDFDIRILSIDESSSTKNIFLKCSSKNKISVFVWIILCLAHDTGMASPL